MPQNLRMPGYGPWEIVRTFVLSQGRHLHQTSYGFYWAPGQPLVDEATAESLPGKYKDEALEWMKAQKESPAPEPEPEPEPATTEETETRSGRQRKRW